MDFFYNTLDNKILSSIISCILIISAILFKLQYNYQLVLGNVLPLLFIAIGFAFIYSSVIIDRANYRDFIRACIAPIAIFATVLLIKNLDIKYEIIKPLLFFGVNIIFFDKEIRGMCV